MESNGLHLYHSSEGRKEVCTAGMAFSRHSTDCSSLMQGNYIYKLSIWEVTWACTNKLCAANPVQVPPILGNLVLIIWVFYMHVCLDKGVIVSLLKPNRLSMNQVLSLSKYILLLVYENSLACPCACIVSQLNTLIYPFCRACVWGLYRVIISI